MAHLLDMSKGRPAFMAAVNGGWHGLGKVVSEHFDLDAGYVGAGHNYEVVKEPIQYKGMTIPNRYATVRTDTQKVLGIVKGRYQVYQNADLWNFADAVIGEGKAAYDTAGAIRDGAMVWILADLNKAFDVVAGDKVDTYMLFVNTHDGSGLATCFTTSVRVVCNNTLTAAIKTTTQRVRIRHTGDLNAKLDAARAVLAQVVGEVEHLQGAMQHLARKQMTTEEVATYFARMLSDRGERGQKKAAAALAEIFENERQTMQGVRGTAWAAYNAVSEWADWGTNYRSADSAFESVVYGSTAELKERAFNLALEMAG